MPIAKKPAAKKEEVAEHKHDDLVKQIADLKKELQAVKAESADLKGQCHSCCGDIANLKKEIALLKEQPTGGKDERVDRLEKLLSQHYNYASLRLALKKAGYKL